MVYRSACKQLKMADRSSRLSSRPTVVAAGGSTVGEVPGQKAVTRWRKRSTHAVCYVHWPAEYAPVWKVVLHLQPRQLDKLWITCISTPQLGSCPQHQHNLIRLHTQTKMANKVHNGAAVTPSPSDKCAAEPHLALLLLQPSWYMQ